MATKPATLTELQTIADDANRKLSDAQRRLDAARSNVIQASGEYHKAIVSMTETAAAGPPAAPAARATAAPASDVSATRARLDQAITEYDAVIAELGV